MMLWRFTQSFLNLQAGKHIAIYGTPGRFLTAQTMMRLRAENLPQPGALGMFTSGGDLSQCYGCLIKALLLDGVSAAEPDIDTLNPDIRAYRGGYDPKDPLFRRASVTSPISSLFVTTGTCSTVK